MSISIIITILSVVLGSGASTTVASWLLKRFDRKTITPDDLKPLNDKLDRDYRHNQEADANFRDLKLTVLRFMLFQDPHDQNSMEAQIQAGQSYITAGGNGVGHIRLTQLQDEYRWRMEHDDWRFPLDGKPDAPAS